MVLLDFWSRSPKVPKVRNIYIYVTIYIYQNSSTFGTFGEYIFNSPKVEKYDSIKVVRYCLSIYYDDLVDLVDLVIL